MFKQTSTDIFAAAAFSRPATRDGLDAPPPLTQSHSATNVTTVTTTGASSKANSNSLPIIKDRKPSFTRKAASFTSSRRRGSSSNLSTTTNAVVTDAAAPPALPDYALSAAAKVAPRDIDPDTIRSPTSPTEPFAPKMLSRTATSFAPQMPPAPMTPATNPGSFWQPDVNFLHQQITELANKRIKTLDYLRRAHGGRVYWFNSYLLDKTDLGRMPCFESRRLARKATNYLLLGISLPVLVDLYSSTPSEFLRCLGTLLSEFESFQQLRSDSSASLTRARLPNMFRRQGTKTRRSTSAADTTIDEAAAAAAFPSSGAGAVGGLNPGSGTPSVMNFAASESDLLPGEEYAYLLTPSLPFEPDYFETFSTLCDALVDCYARFLALVPTSRECTASVAEQFNKADARVRKIIVQGTIKEFEDTTRTHVKTEVASIGKVVLGGLM